MRNKLDMKLIIINGPCGVGKSTVASKVHESMPLSFLLDIDAQSRYISHYQDYQEERWELRDSVANSIIETTLGLGRSVIIDKMTFKPDVLDFYYALAKKYKADIHEIILWAPKDIVMKRADERGWKKGGLLTPEKCERFWHEIDELKENRPLATVIDISNMNENAVFKKVQEVLS